VAIDNKLGGIIAIEDSLRDDSLRFLNLLKDSGIKRIIMLTGDNTALIGLGLSGALSLAISALMHNTVTVASAMNSLRLISDKTSSVKELRHKKMSQEGV